MRLSPDFLRHLLLPILLIFVAACAWHPIQGGDDFWAHAAIGRWILENQSVPKSTLFLWSADTPWVFHSYLSGAIFAAILQLFGPFGALVFNVGMSALPFVLIWRFAARQNPNSGQNSPLPSLFALVLGLAIYASAARFRLRPEMFSALFLTLTLLFLLQTTRPKWQFVAVVFLFALWPNLHAGVLLGILLLWLGALAISLQKRQIQMPLLGLAALCSLVPWLCNPWGFGYLKTYSGTLEVAANVVEWRPFWQSPPLTPEVALAMLFLLGAALVMQLGFPKRSFVALGATLLLGVLFLQSRRQLWLASLVCAASLATTLPFFNADNLYSLLKRQKIEIPTPMRAIGRTGVILVLLGLLFGAPTPKWQAVSPQAPQKMSEFLATQAPQGRIFNDYESSAALEWFLAGRREIYIDLINAYPPALLTEYIRITESDKPNAALRVLETKKIDLIALRPLKTKNEPLKPLVKFLTGSKTWKLIYNGPDGRIWHRINSFAPNQPYNRAAQLGARRALKSPL